LLVSATVSSQPWTAGSVTLPRPEISASSGKLCRRQRWWLDRIAQVIAESAGVSADDLDTAPFTERGGVDGALADLGPGVADMLKSMNTELTA